VSTADISIAKEMTKAHRKARIFSAGSGVYSTSHAKYGLKMKLVSSLLAPLKMVNQSTDTSDHP